MAIQNGVTRNVQQLDDNGNPTGQVTRESVPVRTQAPVIKQTKWLNKRTGEEEMVPEGIDPGWDYNPGTGRLVELDRQLRIKQQLFDGGS